MRRNKYGNRKVEFDGMTFDSKIERDRYLFLLQKQNEGEIRNLKRQTEFPLIPRQSVLEYRVLKTKVKEVEFFREHPVSYIADFSYEIHRDLYGYRDIEKTDFGLVGSGWVQVVEDCKGASSGRWSSQTPDFRIKKKLMLFIHGIEVMIISKANQWKR